MSIETLLEAAKFLELQAQQQQKTREENELREKLEQLSDHAHRRSDVTSYSSPIRKNRVTCSEELSTNSEHHSPPVLSQLLPPSVFTTVIPIPMVTSSHTGLPPTVAAPSNNLLLSQRGAAPDLTSPRREPYSPVQDHQRQGASLALSPQVKSHHSPLAQPGNHKQNNHNLPQLVSSQSGNHKLLQKQQHQSPQLVPPYHVPIVSTTQQPTLLPQPVTPQTPRGGQTSPVGGQGSPPDLDGKKRPGGAGTREVHNKLEKNRRAHLKECFDSLKKNIPNADEKKSSNLSVLRSALRYIQTLKRKEKEYEHEMERLAREKIATQQRLAELKNDLSQWMNVIEIDRVLRQTVQPEDDQASTSTASEGEDMDEDVDDEKIPASRTALTSVPQPAMQPEQATTVTPILTQHISMQYNSQPQSQPQSKPHPLSMSALPISATFSTPPSLQPAHTHIITPSSALLPGHTHMVTAPSLQPTVIAHGSASHASVIQAVNHVIQASSGGAKHLAHLATSSSASMQLTPGHHQPIGHITVHPVTHLGPHHLPTIYPQPVAIAHTLTHAAHVNGASPSQGTATIVGKQTAVGAQMVTHHPHLVGQTMLNPVAMVTMPSFPVSTLKLA
ncbi:hypothetical protein DPEC_G00246750 [Dallia pectoralis]|uniref:Uncharacterized protein n=1 Tax=Dallia pectoralis TaxID=75939 RepID=A0ACC2FWC5_DALPE|nr:hypothetical protein DPEC_G00246750 [Dallia pectoralis]